MAPDEEKVAGVEGAAPHPAPPPPVSVSRPLQPSDKVDFEPGRRGTFIPRKQSRLRNNLLATVGFAELANAGDFAANVWNELPVPIYAVVFMAIGGTVAAILFMFSVKDALLSYENIRFLKRERLALKKERAELTKEAQTTAGIDTLLDLSFRELGIEIINRFGMDILLGFGAMLISVGTFMAIAGQNPHIFFASNLLSGYIGNGPVTLYGIFNAIWSGYLFRKVSSHMAAASQALPGSPVLYQLKRRARAVQAFTCVTGIAGLVGGIASMLTARWWWGYVILIPVIVSSIFSNFCYRKGVAYSRPELLDTNGMNELSLVRELGVARAGRRAFGRRQSIGLRHLVSDATSWPCVLQFLVANDLLEDFVTMLLRDRKTADAILEPRNATGLVLTSSLLLDAPPECHANLIALAQECLEKHGMRRFRDREAYCSELLWSYIEAKRRHG